MKWDLPLSFFSQSILREINIHIWLMYLIIQPSSLSSGCQKCQAHICYKNSYKQTEISTNNGNWLQKSVQKARNSQKSRIRDQISYVPTKYCHPVQKISMSTGNGIWHPDHHHKIFVRENWTSCNICIYVRILNVKLQCINAYCLAVCHPVRKLWGKKYFRTKVSNFNRTDIRLDLCEMSRRHLNSTNLYKRLSKFSESYFPFKSYMTYGKGGKMSN